MIEGWTDRAGLIELAAEHGYTVTARSLELWRYRGLLPRPQRQPRGRAIWLYPPGTGRQLLRLLYWRARAQNLDAVRVALWVQGFPIERDGVREAMLSLVDAASAAFKRELEPLREQPDTIHLLASRFAAMRSKAPFPRVVRMTASERTRAYGYLIALAIGDRVELQRRKDDAKLLERMTGLRSGHGEGLACISPLNDDIVRLLPQLSADDIRAVINDASDDEYELVRWAARTVLVFLPLLLPLLRSSAGQQGVALLNAAEQLFSDPPAATYQALTLFTLLSLKAKALAPEEISKNIANLSPGTVNAEIRALLSSEPVMQAALRQLGADHRERLEHDLEPR